MKVLGRGANVLVSDDGFDGVVVRLDAPAFRRTRRNGDQINAGAGADLMQLSKQCSNEGLSGLECMAGIPASIGGAVRMNAGGRFGDFGAVVRSVDVMKPNGDIERWPREKVGFSYRHSGINENVVLSAQLQLREDDPTRVRKSFDDLFELKRRTQPLADHSAGCIFKNPEGQSAGALIDRAGLKGARFGEAQVSQQHANFIVAREGATASDVLHLIDLVRDRVRKEFNTELEMEVDVWRPTGQGRVE